MREMGSSSTRYAATWLRYINVHSVQIRDCWSQAAKTQHWRSGTCGHTSWLKVSSPSCFLNILTEGQIFRAIKTKCMRWIGVQMAKKFAVEARIALLGFGGIEKRWSSNVKKLWWVSASSFYYSTWLVYSRCWEWAWEGATLLSLLYSLRK